jgi:hypothetical protein
VGLQLWGALAFGIVIGWITYRTLRRGKESNIGDIASVIAAMGGGAVVALFPTGTDAFGIYGIGLAVGFFVYLAVSLLIAARTQSFSAVNEWLGEDQAVMGGGTAGRAAVDANREYLHHQMTRASLPLRSDSIERHNHRARLGSTCAIAPTCTDYRTHMICGRARWRGKGGFMSTRPRTS